MTAARLKSQNGDLLVRDGSVDTSIKSGIAKVLEKHDDAHNIDNSMNVSTLTDNGAGDTTVNYTNSMVNIHQYVVNGTGNDSTQNRWVKTSANETYTTSTHRYVVINSAVGDTDSLVNCSIVHGDLA